MNYYKVLAARVPAELRKYILQENFIGKAINNDQRGTPMEYLFDVYEEFIDARGDYEDWNCFKCREHVLNDWRKMEPLLKELEENKNA